MIPYSKTVSEYLKEQSKIYSSHFDDWLSEGKIIFGHIYETQYSESVLQDGFNLALAADGGPCFRADSGYTDTYYLFVGDEKTILNTLHTEWRKELEGDDPPRTQEEQKHDWEKSCVENEIEELRSKLESK